MTAPTVSASRPFTSGKIAVADVIVEGRIRRDLGDVDELAASMAELGQLQPIVITPERVLIAGERRLRAAQKLGWTHIEMRVAHTIVEQAALLQAEASENTHRKDFTALERLELAKRLRGPLVEQARRGDLEGRIRDHIGAAVGWSGRTVEKALAIADAAADEVEHETVRRAAAEALESLATDGRVDPAWRRVQRARERLAGRAKPLGRHWARKRLTEALRPVTDAGLEAQVAAVEQTLRGPDGPALMKAIRSRSGR